MTMLHVCIPDYCGDAGRYAAEVIFSCFLRIPAKIEMGSMRESRITFSGRHGAVVVPDVFFDKAHNNWLAPETLPRTPLDQLICTDVPFPFRTMSRTLPVLFHDRETAHVSWQDKNREIRFGFDLLGAVFFMISRYEECVLNDADEHGRFKSTRSIAAREGFLMRPIVNEYLELLWGAISSLWPELERGPRSFRKLISCDVDHLERQTIERLATSLRQAAGSIVKRCDGAQARQILHREYEARALGSSPYEDLHWIMNENERAGNKVAFYFLAGITVPEFDGNYDIGSDDVIKVLRNVNSRGHEIGLHNSYGTLADAALIGCEREALANAAARAQAELSETGMRAHFLRWNPLRSPKAADEARLCYDTTLGFADAAGFRCGVCYEFPMFDLVNRRSLEIIQRPLTIMEVTLFRAEYMGLNQCSEEPLRVIETIKEACKWCSGDFTLLWHNSHLTTRSDREIYLASIA